jgi:hypothetical protein
MRKRPGLPPKDINPKQNDKVMTQVRIQSLIHLFINFLEQLLVCLSSSNSRIAIKTIQVTQRVIRERLYCNWKPTNVWQVP